jgi:TPR repeat protein
VTARATGNGAAEDEDDTADETKKKTTPNTHLRKLGTFLGLQCTCPITQGIMIEPVITADGNTYERLAIQQWLEKHDTSPKTNLPLTHKHLVPNLAMKQQIEELVLSETLDSDICEDYKEQVFMRSPEYAKKLLAEGKMEEALRLELPLAFGEMAKRSFKGTDGLPKDIILAVEWATKAGGKDGQALWVLGEAYASGAYRRGLMPDGKRIDKAAAYFRDAATMRYYPPAMCRLGIAYETADLGLVKDVKAAMSWYKKGANADHLSSMLNYGRMFEYGVGTERDYDAARLWYAKASSRGHAGSKRKLGSMLAKGRGGPIDLSGAYALWMEAAGKGDEIAKANIATFNDKLKQTLDRMFQS